MEPIKAACQTLEGKLKLVQPAAGTQSTHQNSECVACNGTGFARVEGQHAVRECECRLLRILDARLAALPKRFRECRFENYRPTDEQEAHALHTLSADPTRNYFLTGLYGRGKTHLAAAQYRTLVEAGADCTFRTMSDLLHELQAAELRNETSQVLQKARHSESLHLFIDDIDKFKTSEFRQQALFDLFDAMYRRKLSVTITSNLSIAMLGELERIEPAVLRRIDDMCVSVEV